MWLTRFEMGPAERRRMGLLEEGDVHAFVYGLFPSAKERSFLYRSDGRRDEALRLTVLSKTCPRLKGWMTAACREVPEGFYGKTVYKFRIRFAAVKQIRCKGERNPKTFRIGNMDAVMEKLEALGPENGIEFIPGVMRVTGVQQCEIPHGWKDHTSGGKIPFKSMDIEGVLKVSDAGLFRAAVEKGLGRFKGFGCGMLELEPII